MKKIFYESPVCKVEEFQTNLAILQTSGSVEESDLFDGGSWDAVISSIDVFGGLL